MTNGLRYRNEINGLRAIAVVAVILAHFDAALVPSGHLGVDIFFVISGYVISLSLCGREHKSLARLLLGFYARRLKRLMPALIVCVLLTTGAICLIEPLPAASLRTGIAALFGLSNLYLWKQRDDYFGPSIQHNALMHTWSLGVEEQFYLLFPVLLWMLLLRRGGSYRAFFAVTVAASMVSLLLYAAIGRGDPMMAFYLMPLRFWELAVGCVIAVRQIEHRRGEATAGPFGQGLIVVSLIAALFAPARFGIATTIVVVALSAAALVLLAPGSLAFRTLTSRLATYLGLISYSLYLWHWPVLVLARYTIGVRWATAPVLAAVTMLLAMLSYHLVERTLRIATWARSPARTVLAGGGGVLVAALLVAVLAWPLHGRLYTGQPARLTVLDRQGLNRTYRIAGTPYRWAGPPCMLESDADVGRMPEIDACTLGAFEGARRRVMVFGNSFSVTIVMAFDALVRDDGYAATLTSSWGASPVPDLPNHTRWARASGYYWSKVYPAITARLRAGDWVLLANELSRLEPLRPDATSRWELATFERALRRQSAELARRGVRLAVLDVAPSISEAQCTPDMAMPQWFALHGGSCAFPSRAEALARRKDADAMLRRLDREGVLTLIDPFDALCPGGRCTFQGARGEVLYLDSIHPSEAAARDIAPLFRAALTRPPAVGAMAR